jgi:transcription-repair coupling factor (superfamily II helicase)
MDKILEHFHKQAFFKNLDQSLKSNEHIKLTDVPFELRILLTTYIEKYTKVPLLIVTPNIYQAQKVYDELSRFLGDQLLFFPQDEFLTTEMLAMSREFKLERIHTIQKIIEETNPIVVTNTTGYVKKILPKNAWEDASIRLHKGQVIEQDWLLKKLIYLGYERVDAIEQQGQFSLRGSIFDIYPLNEEHPIRVDFFDDEIDTIRTFDLESQRSKLYIQETKIYPMYELFYTDDQYKLLKETIQDKVQKQSFDATTIERIEEDLLYLEQHQELDKLGRYGHFIYPKLETISEYLGDHKVLYFELEKIKDHFHVIVEDIKDWYESSDDYPKLGFDLIEDMNRLYHSQEIVFEALSKTSKHKKEIAVRSKEPIPYQNNIHMAIKDIKKQINYTTVVIAFENKKKRDNFVELIDQKIPYTLLGTEDSIKEKQLNLMVNKETIPTEFFDANTIVLNETILFHQKETKKAKYRATFKDSKKVTSVEELKKGDYIVHYEYGIGRFLGVETMTVGDLTNDYIYIQYKGDDALYIPIENIHLIQKYVASEGLKPKLHKLGSGEWAKTKQRVRKKVKDIADKLIKLYAAREQAEGFAYSQDTELQEEFEAEFPYQETEDQLKAIQDVKKDMEASQPMDRLLCGDVGYGKTEVALRAAFKAVLDNKQVAYLAPTTVLARQHYYTFKNRLEHHGIKVELLNRFVTPAHQRRTLKRLKEGSVDIVIGTHRLLSKDVKFLDLGMLIIDEEQRFGVEHKEKIKEMRINIDVLSLSATPIPRTLQMAIMGVKSMSLLETPPKNRYPIQTYVLERRDSIIRDAIERELARQGQTFYLYNRVDDIGVVTAKLKRLVPDARICYAHGKMSRKKLEEVIEDFLNKEYDVLVSTTIIETGIDIPNANTLIIHDADKLGLSQLYQIRGRVGRSDRIAYAYLMYSKQKQLTEEAVKRLRVIKEFTELGSGFKIAVRDLSIRGAGDILGTEQSGFMDSVGIDLYLEMLKDEIAIRQGNKEAEPVEKEAPPIRIGVSKYISNEYIASDDVKIAIHKKIAKLQSLEEITQLVEELTDRFGKPSKDLELYMYEKLFEHLAKEKGVEKVRETKNNVFFMFTEEASQNINGEVLFMKANDISKYIRFTYKNKKIQVIIDTIKLPTHYLYPMTKLLEIL